jgi:hypothetical protein
MGTRVMEPGFQPYRSAMPVTAALTCASRKDSTKMVLRRRSGREGRGGDGRKGGERVKYRGGAETDEVGLGVNIKGERTRMA